MEIRTKAALFLGVLLVLGAAAAAAQDEDPATRAESLLETDDPNRFVRAREVALAGRRDHPDTPVGQRCDRIVRRIEQPSYHVDSGNYDGVGRRSLLVRHKNIEKIYFRAHRFDPEKRFLNPSEPPPPEPEGMLDEFFEEFARGYEPWFEAHDPALESLTDQEPDAEWSVTLPATPDFRMHNTWVTPPLGAGSYIVVASARADFAEDDNLRIVVPLLLGDLVLARPADGRPLVTVRSGADGRPREGVAVRLYRVAGDSLETDQFVAERKSDTNGVADFRDVPRIIANTPPSRSLRYRFAARVGDEAAFLTTYLHPEWPRRDSESAVIYTDRSVYRPGQRLLFKVVGYHDDGLGHFRALEKSTIDVQLHDANRDEVASLRVTLNRFGSASGEFTIPHGRLLGSWRLSTSIGGLAVARVEEYKRPTFDVALDTEKTLHLNREAVVHGTARYYLGLPVTGGRVTWRVARGPARPGIRRRCTEVLPSGDAERYLFVPEEYVAHGTADLDDEGRFEVAFVPEAGEDDVTYRFDIEVEVTDPGGETRSASHTFPLGRATVETFFEVPDPDGPGFLDAGREIELVLRRRGLDGTPRAGEARWRLLRVAQPEQTRMPYDLPREPAGEGVFETPGDLLRARWETDGYCPEAEIRSWEDGGEVASGVLRHAEDGVARLAIPPLEAGVYRWLYTTQDPSGTAFEMEHVFVLAGTTFNVPALLRPQTLSVPFGKTLRVLAGTGLPGQEALLRISRPDRPVEERKVRGFTVVEIPIGEDERGGLGLALDVLHDHQLIHFQEHVRVPWDDRRLRVTLETFRDRLRPGERETWTLRVEDAGVKDTVEILASMYDRSLDVLEPHRPPNPLAWYPQWRGYLPYTVSFGHLGALRLDVDGSFIPIPWPEREEPEERWEERWKATYWKSVGELQHISSSVFSYTRGSDPAERASAVPWTIRMVYAGGALSAVSNSGPPATAEVRRNFQETAFWEPHLLLGDDGIARFEFTVPDSLTEWNVWAQALTTDLRSGQAAARVRTVKDLMVRPYLPRFLRAGDRAELRVLVQAAGETTLSGDVTFDLVDPETEESVAERFSLTEKNATFTVEPGGSVERRFSIKVPDTLQDVAVRVVARSGKNSDGELRPLPVLPSRIHLMQTRFVTLKDAGERTMTFDDLLSEDATRINDQLVVTVNGQLLSGVLAALPYLVNYPYECSEQTLNRFLSTSILTSFPVVQRMAEQLSPRETRLEAFRGDDPNRRMAMTETPWLMESRGGGAEDVLSPQAAKTQRLSAFRKLEKLQMLSGAFPWFPGGPPSTYMTLYVLDGLSRALEFQVGVPEYMIQRAWEYVHSQGEGNPRFHEDNLENTAYVVYLLSAYPDLSWTGDIYTEDDRKALLDVVEGAWRSLPRRFKWQAALALQRAGRDATARAILEAAMDSSRTTEDEGTFWMPEDRAWLWQNDTIESHAFALRAMNEIAPQDKRRHGLVQWLFLNKKLNHWKSTRATAEVIYSLAHYLKQEGQLGIREEARVRIGPANDPVRTETFVFEPDVYTGKANRVVLEGASIDERATSTTVSKETPGLMFATAAWHFSTEQPPEEARGDFFTVKREFFRRVHDGREWTLVPLQPGDRVEVGDQVEVRLRLTSKHPAEYVHLRDPRGAGFEPESLRSGYRWENVGYYEEVRDSGANFFFERLPVGEVVLRHRLRATVAGTFRVAPATVQSMYAPDFAAYSSGVVLGVY